MTIPRTKKRYFVSFETFAEIRRLRKEDGWLYKQIAYHFNLSESYIQMVCSGKRNGCRNAA